MQHKTTLGKTTRVLAALMVMIATILPVAAVAAPEAAPLAQPESGTITGTVFRDYNANGTRQTWANSGGYFNEPGIPGVIVTAYDVNNAVQGTTTTGADGTYSLSAGGTGPYRIEFTLPTDGSMNYLKPGAAGATTVQFVPDGNSSGIDVGFNNPNDYSQDAPPLITPITFVGERSLHPVGRNESIVGIAYNAQGDLSAPANHTVYARLTETGTLYGMIYQRKSKLILAGTYMKAYADIGPVQNTGWLAGVDPMGAIYASKVDQTLPNSAVYANLNKVINPATGVVIGGNPAGVNPRQTGGYDYDNDLCPTAPLIGDCWNHDPAAWSAVGSSGLGDLDQDDDERFVFVVNLGDKSLYQLPIDPDPSNWPITTLAAPPVAIPNNCANPADAVPGALGFSDGKLYVGVTCTAESSQLLNQLKVEVWQFDPVLQVFSAAPLLTVPLDFPRGCIWADGPNNVGSNDPKTKTVTPWQNCQPYIDGSSMDFHNASWNPWPQTWTQHYTSNKGRNAPGKPGWDNQSPQRLLQIEYPHPWLSDIAFDGTDIVLGFRDINGDRTGNDVRSPNINATAPPTSGPAVTDDVLDYAYIMDGAGFGDMLRACGTPGNWTLESNGVCGNLTSINGQNSGQGPGPGNSDPNDGSTGWGEFYWDDSGPGSRNPSTDLIATWAVQGWGTAGINDPANNYRYFGHEETLKGGIFQRAGSPDIAVTQADQLNTGDGGIARFSHVVDHPDINDPYPGLRNPSRVGTAFGNNDIGIALLHTALYGNLAGFFGKANGLGDMEALLDPAPLEIGNRLWCDTGVGGVGAYNGIQDPGEATVPAGVVVRLTCGSEYAEVTTGGDGTYLFTDTIWNASVNTSSSVIPREANCTISVDTTGANATLLTSVCDGVAPTTPNVQGDSSNSPVYDIRDSDAFAVRSAGAIVAAQIPFRTGGPGVNNHGLDIGFGLELDWGDAPDGPYPTLAINNGAVHRIVPGIRMGALIDGEQDGQPNAAATGDDSNNLPDEDGVTFGPLVAGQPATANVDMTTLPSGLICYLNAWIDFNGNGSWLDLGDQIATNLPLNGGGVVTVNFTVPSAVTTNPTYARFRCSTDQNLAPDGYASDGEVEDYRVTISVGSLDWGDAPDPGYPTLAASNGASHVLGDGFPILGLCVDAELDGQPTVGAVGDDNTPTTPRFGTCAPGTNNDDEDGVFIPTLTAGSQSTLQVTVSVAQCYLNAWIDFNGNGSWNDPGEQIATNLLMSLGVNNLNVTPPAGSTQAQTYARFRCSTQQGLGPTGPAPDGEVEDYALVIQPGADLLDWGDAPDSLGYPTLAASNGASHVVPTNPQVYLGQCVDTEPDGQPNVGATGDDTNTGGSPTGGNCAAGQDDEDGVAIPPLVAGQTAQIVVTSWAPTGCTLNAWIDFNGNGNWNDPGEQVAVNFPVVTGGVPNNLSVPVPVTAVGGTTYARFRCSTQPNLGPTGPAPDGEVEDYAVTITAAALDWGDLPDGPYPTLAASNGAVHVMSPLAYMGKCVDSEADGQPNATATGDDLNLLGPSATTYGLCATPGDDEDAVTFSPMVAGQPAFATIDMSGFNTGAQVCLLNAWIDFNGNGSLTDPGEQIATNITMIGGGPNVINFNVPLAVTTLPTGARFRCSTQANLAPTGLALDGEVEDYMVLIQPDANSDFGDAPDPGYPTLATSNGASHVVPLLPTVWMGPCVDTEPDGQPNPTATGDDTNTGGTPTGGNCVSGQDDEDGVTLPGAGFIQGQTSNVNVLVVPGSPTAVVCYLNAWIDFNQNGNWNDPGEQIATDQPMFGGGTSNVVAVSVPGTAATGSTYARFRCSTQTGLLPTGAAPDGEVEDYLVQISVPLSVLLAGFDAAAQSDHVLVTWETVSEASNSGFNLYRSLSADGAYTLLGFTPSASPGSTQGAAYSFQDFNVTDGQTYWYQLEDVALSGAATMHGPVSVLYQAPTAVELSQLATDAGAGSLPLLWLLAALLAAGAGLIFLRRRSVA